MIFIICIFNIFDSFLLNIFYVSESFFLLHYFSWNISFVLVYRSIWHGKHIYLSFVHHLYIQDLVYKFLSMFKIFWLKNIFVIIIIFTKLKFVNFVKKVCSGERDLSLHIYHSFECFQKLTGTSKKYHILLYTYRQTKLHILIKIYQRHNMQLIKIKK